MADDIDLQQFLDFSVLVTGYDAFRLRGTGQAERYLATTQGVIGRPMLRELLDTHAGIVAASAGSVDALEAALQAQILGDAKLGPIARNIIKLWFIGTWYRLPDAWREAYGAMDGDTTFVPAPESYTEGLLWPTIDANPQGAKGPGYGTWALPPRISVGD